MIESKSHEKERSTKTVDLLIDTKWNVLLFTGAFIDKRNNQEDITNRSTAAK